MVCEQDSGLMIMGWSEARDANRSSASPAHTRTRISIRKCDFGFEKLLANSVTLCSRIHTIALCDPKLLTSTFTPQQIQTQSNSTFLCVKKAVT